MKGGEHSSARSEPHLVPGLAEALRGGRSEREVSGRHAQYWLFEQTCSSLYFCCELDPSALQAEPLFQGEP